MLLGFLSAQGHESQGLDLIDAPRAVCGWGDSSFSWAPLGRGFGVSVSCISCEVPSQNHRPLRDGRIGGKRLPSPGLRVPTASTVELVPSIAWA